jgi:uncharacterized small protein (DUF1192 family)
MQSAKELQSRLITANKEIDRLNGELAERIAYLEREVAALSNRVSRLEHSNH